MKPEAYSWNIPRDQAPHQNHPLEDIVRLCNRVREVSEFDKKLRL